VGEWFHVVCHTCGKRHTLILSKRREILLNLDVAAQIGQFAAIHAGHELELRGDECSRLDERDTWAYEPDDPADDEDVMWAAERTPPPLPFGG
jgi:hypothetical protein